MKIEEAINSWFEQTQERITEISRIDETYTTSFCAVATAVMKLYCRAAGHLIDNHFRLPAMALLRVISEFFIKFIWSTKIWTDEEIRKRVARWEKTSAQKKIKLLDDLLKNGVFSEEDLTRLKNEKDKEEKSILSNRESPMPHITGKGSLFEDVASVFGANLSGLYYGQYCSYIHIPTSILTGFVEVDNGSLSIKDDIDENAEELGGRCLNFAYMFLKVLYHRYGCDMNTIQKEYEKMTGLK